MKLNSKIKTLDIVNSPVPLVVNLSGKFEISYANHFTEEQDLVNLISELYVDDSILNIDINLELSYQSECCLLYTSPSPRDVEESRMPSSA